MATQTKNQSDYSTRGNAEHTENTARDERRAMAWTPQEEVAYAKEEKQLRTEARFDRFLQNFEKGAATDDQARDLLFDSHGLTHLNRDQHQSLNTFENMKAPLQEWQLREYRSKLHNSVESVAHKYETLGYNQASVARITEHLDRTADKLADDKEDQTSDARGYVEYTPRTGRMNFTTSFETEYQSRANSMELYQAITDRTVTRNMTERYLIGDYDGSHLTVAERLEMARLHRQTRMMADGHESTAYAEGLNTSQERLIELFTQETGLQRYEFEKLAVYLADVRKEMVGEHWKYDPPERTAEHALGLTPEGDPWKPTFLQKLQGVFDTHSSPYPMHPDRENNPRRAFLGLSQESHYGPKY